VAKTNVVPLFRPSPRDQWLNELEDELRGLLETLPAHPGRLKLPLQARAWRAVARVLVTRELGANQFGRSYANAVWRTVEGYAERRLSSRTLRAVFRRVDLLASERPLRPVVLALESGPGFPVHSELGRESDRVASHRTVRLAPTTSRPGKGRARSRSASVCVAPSPRSTV
jgi:hypothetical protein